VTQLDSATGASPELRVSSDELRLPTDRRLILAAERLFAERGVDAVSLRAINAAAGTNVASLHYHFGSKEALLEALIRERSQEVSQRRALRLDSLETGKKVSARRLAEAFVVPVAEMATSGGEAWVRFIAGLISSGHPALSIVTHGFFDQARRFHALLRKVHPDWSDATVLFRLSQAMYLTFRVLGDVPGVQSALTAGGVCINHNEVVDELIDLVSAQLSGPSLRQRNVE
jgi:AcrR family transcriptional regulator